MRTFEPIKVNPCSAKPTALDSSIIKGKGFLVLLLCSYGFWLPITKETGTLHYTYGS